MVKENKSFSVATTLKLLAVIEYYDVPTGVHNPNNHNLKLFHHLKPR